MKDGGFTRTRGGDPAALGTNPEMSFAEEEIGGVSLEELREFLEADPFEVPADPGFKERLRRTLWDLVVERAEKSAPDEDL